MIATALTDARKSLVALAGVLAQVLELGLLHGTAQHYAQVASTIVAAVLVYVVPNGSSDDDQGDGDVPAVEPDEPAPVTADAPPVAVPADPSQPAAGVPPAVPQA